MERRAKERAERRMERSIEGDLIKGEKRGGVGKTKRGTETERWRKRGRKRNRK